MWLRKVSAHNENNTKYKTVKKIILVGVAISIVGLSYFKKVI